MKYPVLFVGHGSPMLALEDNAITQNFKAIGDDIIATYGKPKAILAISAHWFTRGEYLQREENPRQVYDMYGFPDPLYELRYDVKGDVALSDRISEILGDDVAVDNSWGIDHGTWSVLVHMFPKADIPVVQLSVNGGASEEMVYALGKALSPLREEGILIIGSGNIVHNLRAVDWRQKGASDENRAFDAYITDAIKEGDMDAILHHRRHPQSAYAVPTVDHFYPLLYTLGAADGDKATVFNQVGDLGAISMTSFIFTDDEWTTNKDYVID